MSALIPVWNGSITPRCWANSANSNTVTNTTTETAFDQFLTVPAGTGGYTNAVMRLSAMGIMSTALLNLGFTFRIRWGGTGITGTVIGASSGLSLASSISDGGWSADVVIRVINTDTAGTMELQGQATFQGGALTNIPLYIPNTGTFAVDNSIDNNVYLTAQWTTASASNQIQIRSLIVDLNRP